MWNMRRDMCNARGSTCNGGGAGIKDGYYRDTSPWMLAYGAGLGGQSHNT
jgi:hypothetical protein